MTESGAGKGWRRQLPAWMAVNLGRRGARQSENRYFAGIRVGRTHLESVWAGNRLASSNLAPSVLRSISYATPRGWRFFLWEGSAGRVRD
jgi:hypothetical protein